MFNSPLDSWRWLVSKESPGCFICERAQIYYYHNHALHARCYSRTKSVPSILDLRTCDCIPSRVVTYRYHLRHYCDPSLIPTATPYKTLTLHLTLTVIRDCAIGGQKRRRCINNNKRHLSFSPPYPCSDLMSLWMVSPSTTLRPEWWVSL